MRLRVGTFASGPACWALQCRNAQLKRRGVAALAGLFWNVTRTIPCFPHVLAEVSILPCQCQRALEQLCKFFLFGDTEKKRVSHFVDGAQSEQLHAHSNNFGRGCTKGETLTARAGYNRNMHRCGTTCTAQHAALTSASDHRQPCNPEKNQRRARRCCTGIRKECGASGFQRRCPACHGKSAAAWRVRPLKGA